MSTISSRRASEDGTDEEPPMTRSSLGGRCSVEVEPVRKPIFCLVCNSSDPAPGDTMFIQPCRCGYWVHDRCLVDIALQFEDNNRDTRSVGCRICRRVYNISPAKRFLIVYATKFLTSWYQTFCYMGMKSFVKLVVDITFIKLGRTVFTMIYGAEEAARVISSQIPRRALVTCQLIPVASLVITNINWERGLLEVLRKCSSLPVLGRVFPRNFEEVDIYRGRPDFSVVAGMLLPFYAVVASRLFTGYVEDPFHRFLLGGAAVVLLKGTCKMYYKQKKYVQFCTFTVADSPVPKIGYTR